MFKYLIPLGLIVIGFLFYSMNKPEGEKAFSDHLHSHSHESEEKSFAPSSGTLPEIQPNFDLNRFKQTFPGPWQVSTPSEGIIRLSGAGIPVQLNKDGAIIELTQKVAAQFGVDPRQVSPQVNRLTKTEAEQSFRTYQVLQGVVVFEASMYFQADSQKSEMTVMENGFKKMDRVKMAFKMSPMDALQIFKEKFSAQPNNRGERMIFVKDEVGQAAYRFDFEEKNKKLNVLLSAENGELLFKGPFSSF